MDDFSREMLTAQHQLLRHMKRYALTMSYIALLLTLWLLLRIAGTI